MMMPRRDSLFGETVWLVQREGIHSGMLSSIQYEHEPPPLPPKSPSPTVNDYKYLFGDVVL